jgi:hypothetical protein
VSVSGHYLEIGSLKCSQVKVNLNSVHWVRVRREETEEAT